MLKETKDAKGRPEGLRQPQRKDSFSSVFSWAALQTKPSPLKNSVSSATATPQSPSSSTATTNLKSRRYSHGPDLKKKTRDGSTASRRLSLSVVGGTQEALGAKTRHTKTLSLSAVDSKTTDTVSNEAKTIKSSSTEKVNKQTQDSSSTEKINKQTQDGNSTEKINKQTQESSESPPEQPQQKPPAPSTSPEKPSSIPERPTSPKIIPKSILRVSSPDGQRPPRRIIAYPAPPPTTENGQQPSTGQSPLSPLDQTLPLPGIAEDATSGSPPNSPITRPLSPGATVRFAKATIHRVEVGPGRRFAPVKRKSKSTIAYIAPLDPGANKTTPKNMLASPTKLRRHVENQKAMGRYWMRTEEEEAQWRAEAAMRAAEEAERYRAEPASPPGPAILAGSPAFHGFSWAIDGLEALDKLPPIDSLPSLDKLETEEVEDKLETVVADSDDSDDSDAESPDSGAKIFPMDGDHEDQQQKHPTKAEKDEAKETSSSSSSTETETKSGNGEGNEDNGAPQEVNISCAATKATTTTTINPNAKPTSQEAKTAFSRQRSQQSVMTATTNRNNTTTTTTLLRSPTLRHSRSPISPSIRATATATATSSRLSSIPILTLSSSRPTSPTPGGRISPQRHHQRPLSPTPPSASRTIPSTFPDNADKSIVVSGTGGAGVGGGIRNDRERPYTPTPPVRSTSANHLHLSGRRDRERDRSSGGGGTTATARKVLFDDHSHGHGHGHDHGHAHSHHAKHEIAAS